MAKCTFARALATSSRCPAVQQFFRPSMLRRIISHLLAICISSSPSMYLTTYSKKIVHYPESFVMSSKNSEITKGEIERYHAQRIQEHSIRVVRAALSVVKVWHESLPMKWLAILTTAPRLVRRKARHRGTLHLPSPSTRRTTYKNGTIRTWFRETRRPAL